LGQNARWLQQLEEFSFQLSHRKGTSHANADALSRHPCLSKPFCTACHPELQQQKLSACAARLVAPSEAESSAGRGSNGLESAGSGGADRQYHPADRDQSSSAAPADEANSTDDAAADTSNLVMLPRTVPSNENADSFTLEMPLCGWDRDKLTVSKMTQTSRSSSHCLNSAPRNLPGKTSNFSQLMLNRYTLNGLAWPSAVVCYADNGLS